MKIKRVDVLYFMGAVIFPLLLGSLFYLVDDIHNQQFSFLKNHLPDGLWAFSFVSCLCLIWKNRFNWCWLSIIFLVFLLFEYLQFLQIINGVGDLVDIMFYFTFGITALFIRKKFLKTLSL